MALATRCPFCKTTFRVVHDQLKLRAGLVRCGACKEIFNGVEHLVVADSSESDASSHKIAADQSARANQAASATEYRSADAIPGNSMPAGPLPNRPTLAGSRITDSSPEGTPSTFSRPPDQDSAKMTSAGIDADTAGASSSDIAASDAMDSDTPASDPESPNISRTNPAASDAGLLRAPAHSSSALPSGAPDIDNGGLQSPTLPAWPTMPGSSTARFEPDAGDQSSDPLLRMTLLDISAFHRPEREDDAEHPTLSGMDGHTTSLAPDDAEASDALGRTIDELKQKPWRGLNQAAAHEDDEIDALDAPEPEFVQRARRQQRYGRAVRVWLAVGSALLLVALVLQGAYAFRNQLAVRLPQSAPVLNTMCSVFGCTIGLPARIDLVTIESSELQSLPESADSFALATLLRNRSPTPQAWPHIELTLNDSNSMPVARKVFAPSDYLSPAADSAKILASGLPAKAEQPIRIRFTLSQVAASGYRVLVFYP